MSQPIVINPTLAKQDGINVERLIAYYAHWGHTVVASDNVGRSKTSKTCACCGKNQPLDSFQQAMRKDGLGGRRSRYCADCADLQPTPQERRRLAAERLERDRQAAAAEGITVERLRERQNRGTYQPMKAPASAETKPPRTCRECQQVKPLADFAPTRKGQFHADCVTCRTTPVRECQTCFEHKPLEDFTYNRAGKSVPTRRSSGVLSKNCVACRKASPQGRGYAARVARQAAERANQ